MLFFRYRWVLTFSHGLCVKIIRNSAAIKRLELEIKQLMGYQKSERVIRLLLDKLSRTIALLDDIIFSASALLYREEKSLVRFSRRVEDAARRIIERARREKGKYEREIKRLEDSLRGLKEKKQTLRSQKRMKKEEARAIEEEKRKNEILALLHKITTIIEDLDKRLHDIYLEAKAQRRRIFNTYIIKESIIIRSNFRLGELIGRKGIEVGSLIRRIGNKLKYFSRVVGRKKKLNISEVNRLMEHCILEARDLEDIFMFVVQCAERIEERLDEIGALLKRDAKLGNLSRDYGLVRDRLNSLRREIEVQYMRLDNEFKKGFINRGVAKEMKKKKAA